MKIKKEKKDETITPEVVYTPKPRKPVKTQKNINEKPNKKIKPVEKRKIKKVSKHREGKKKPSASAVGLPITDAVIWTGITGIIVYLLGELGLFGLLLFILYLISRRLWGAD